jgi:effector-binding domain-containing protein
MRKRTISPGIMQPNGIIGRIMQRLSYLVLACFCFSATAAYSQSQPGTPAPASPALPELPVTPAPAAPQVPPALVQPSQPDRPGEVTAGEQRDLMLTPVLRMKGKSTWDDGFATMTSTFAKLKAEAAHANLAVSGNPRLYFIESDDQTFTYEAYLQLGAPPASTSFAPGVEAGQSPAGRVILFPYEGSYDEIDAAYEAIAAWLDDKGLVSTGSFIEEYLTIPPRADDPGLRVSIYVFLK